MDTDLLEPSAFDACSRAGSIAWFGSAFNPPHAGHGACVEELLGRFDVVLASPSIGHAFGKSMAPYPLRLEMARLWAETFLPGQSRLFVVDMEPKLLAALGRDGGALYSAECLDALRGLFPSAQIRLAVGPDNADPETFAKFRESARIASEYGLAVVGERPGARSTLVRGMVERQEPGWEAFVGPLCAGFIRSRGLYGFESEPQIAPSSRRTP